MATVSTLSTKNRRFLRTRELDKIVRLLNGLDLDTDLTLSINVGSTDGVIVLSDLTANFADLRDLVDGMEDDSTLDVTITKDAEGAVTAEETV